eukprot:5608642-Pleurochrysis_carterae.AAC.2
MAATVMEHSKREEDLPTRDATMMVLARFSTGRQQGSHRRRGGGMLRLWQRGPFEGPSSTPPAVGASPARPRLRASSSSGSAAPTRSTGRDAREHRERAADIPEREHRRARRLRARTATRCATR